MTQSLLSCSFLLISHAEQFDVWLAGNLNTRKEVFEEILIKYISKMLNVVNIILFLFRNLLSSSASFQHQSMCGRSHRKQINHFLNTYFFLTLGREN